MTTKKSPAAQSPFSDTLSEHLGRDKKLELFDSIPLPLETFLYDRSQLGLSIRLSPMQLDVLKHSTQIYRPHELTTLGWPIERYVNEVYLEWGKGSGKDLISIITQARIADLLLHLRDPQGYFGQASFSNIDMINMALNADQAKFNFYEPMRRLICKSRRFKNLADDKEKHIAFVKNIYAHSGHSDEEAAEGKNLICAVLDEISGFKTRQEFAKKAQQYRAPKYSYEALIDAMKTSRQSRFDTGKLMAISYPRYKGCPIQQLYNAGLQENKKNPDSKVYVSFGATWDVNPAKKKEQFDEEFKKNPSLVKAKYMCEPSQAEDSYIKNIEILDEIFPPKPEEQVLHTSNDYPALKPGRRAPHNFACSIHVDLALNNCRAGFAMTHQFDVRHEKIMNPDTGDFVDIALPLIGIDVITSFQAPAGGEIDFSEIRRFMFELRAAGYMIGVISYDQWNSAGERQTLDKAGFNVVRRSVDNDKSMYDDLVIAMAERRLHGGYAVQRPYTFAGQTLTTCIIKEELQGLVDLRGKRVDHRAGGSKDESDALAGSMRGAIEFGLWKFGETGEHPTGEQQATPARPMDLAQAESPLIARLQASDPTRNSSPGSLGYRGLPTGR